MNKREANTDIWVYDLLKQAKIEKKVTPQGSNNFELNQALKSASKSKSGNVGKPEFIGVVKDFILVIENKADMSNHINTEDNGKISQEVKNVKNYAVNGALHYGVHLVKNTQYKKVIALGISGDESNHIITPLFIDNRGNYEQLDNLHTLINFSEENIDTYYLSQVLKEKLETEKETEKILKAAEELHNALRNYGNIEQKYKPIIVSGILLALRELKYGFTLDSLTGDNVVTDGKKIYEKIKDNLDRSNIKPQLKKDKLLSQFSIIMNNTKINEVHPSLDKTPVKYFAEFLYKSIFKPLVNNNSSEDYLGRFYGEFMSYSGGDGQNLGIVLTPKHITDLFCELLEVNVDDKILDPCCGTGGFLIASMSHMIKQAKTKEQIKNIKENQLCGIEQQSHMFSIATTNMILRGDGKSNLENEDFFKFKSSDEQRKGYTIGMINPPYSMGGSKNVQLYELSFINKLLDTMVEGGKVATIVPLSSMIGTKTKDERDLKKKILENHTLEGVITLNPNTFYGVGTSPCIGIFTAHTPHDKNKMVKFMDFTDDGYVVKSKIGLLKSTSADDKKQKILNVWNNDKLEVDNSIRIDSKIKIDDEWIHSFYYFNETPPIEQDFQDTIDDYLSFEVNMILENRDYLFKKEKN